jgi:hypothetical protein
MDVSLRKIVTPLIAALCAALTAHVSGPLGAQGQKMTFS